MARQDIDPLPGLGVDQSGRVRVTAAQGEVIDAEHRRHADLGQASRSNTRSAVRRESGTPRLVSSPAPARPANRRAASPARLVSRVVRRW